MSATFEAIKSGEHRITVSKIVRSLLPSLSVYYPEASIIDGVISEHIKLKSKWSLLCLGEGDFRLLYLKDKDTTVSTKIRSSDIDVIVKTITCHCPFSVVVD